MSFPTFGELAKAEEPSAAGAGWPAAVVVDGVVESDDLGASAGAAGAAPSAGFAASAAEPAETYAADGSTVLANFSASLF